jgi:hypothetical protein
MKTIRLILIILFIVLTTGFSIWAIQSVFPRRSVLARIGVIAIPVNKPFSFVDSTRMASSWLWLFGDGSSAVVRHGFHSYKRAGRYLIKLIVDNELTQMMEINVFDEPTVVADNDVITIDGPLSGFQGEYLLFTAQGHDTHWRWNMGEGPGVDSREAMVMHKYDHPGTYNIRLMSENSKYPALFVLKILPPYTEQDSTDAIGMLDLVNRDIRVRLQRIANGKDFNENYYYLVNKYFCKDEHVPVTIDGKKINDFFSYCMGLRLDAGVVIGSVTSDRRAVADTASCVMHLHVKQH